MDVASGEFAWPESERTASLAVLFDKLDRPAIVSAFMLSPDKVLLADNRLRLLFIECLTFMQQRTKRLPPFNPFTPLSIHSIHGAYIRTERLDNWLTRLPAHSCSLHNGNNIEFGGVTSDM